MSPMRTRRAAVALAVVVTFLTAGCAGSLQQAMQRPGQAALLCGAGGAAAGAAMGGAISRDWTGALIGAAAGALVGSLSCFAVAEYRTRQVRDHGQTRDATGYDPTQGDTVKITHYQITPAATAPGSDVTFNATYHVMTPEPDQDIAITEVRTLHVWDAQQNTWREMGRVPNQVTVKPGTRVADGKFKVRSGVAEGSYRVGFEVVKASLTDAKQVALTVTRNQASLTAPAARVASVGTPDTAAGETAPSATPPTAPLSTLGEQQPKAPVIAAGPAVAKAGGAAPLYFRASKVTGSATLRGGPGASHTVVGTINQGDRFPIVDRATNPSDGIWYRIRLDSGAEAWVMGSLGVEVGE